MADAGIGQKAEIALDRMRGSGLARKGERGMALLPDCARWHASATVGTRG